MRTRAVLLGLVAGLLAHLLLVAAAAAVLATVTAPHAGAQAPPDDAAVEAQALEIERQLLCPQCTNKRLDVCELAICEDMRRSIREQLRQGRHPEDILLFFRSRYGDRVMASVPREGFNLALFGWTAGSVALVALLGGGYVLHLRNASRRRAAERAAAGGPPEDEEPPP